MKNRNFVEHRIPKIKIHFKLTSLKKKKRGTKPNPPSRVRDSSVKPKGGTTRTCNE